MKPTQQAWDKVAAAVRKAGRVSGGDIAHMITAGVLAVGEAMAEKVECTCDTASGQSGCEVHKSHYGAPLDTEDGSV